MIQRTPPQNHEGNADSRSLTAPDAAAVPEDTLIDADLEAVSQAWPELPERVKDVVCEDGQEPLEDHARDVVTVAISRDGRRISPCDIKGLLRTWDLEYGQELRQLTGSPETYSLAICPDGRFLVSGANGPIYLWDSR